MKRLSLIYLAAYLFVGGTGFAFLPDLTLALFFSTGSYDGVMVRVVGMFMLALSGMIASMVRYEDYKYYPYSVVARSFIVMFLTWMYVRTSDPLFLVLDGVVLVGLLPSIYVLIREKQ